MSNFYSRIPAIGTTLGTVFALTVATPLVVSLIAKFTLGGNKAAVPYADTYIRNSDTIVVTIRTCCDNACKQDIHFACLVCWNGTFAKINL